MRLRGALAALPERALRATLLALSHRRTVGRIATRLPITRPMVAQFVAGETLDEALVALQRLAANGLATSVDVLGESVRSADTARAAGERYLATIDALAARGLTSTISLKLSQMGLDIDPEICRTTVERVFDRAAERGTFVRIDMEEHTKTDATLDLWRSLRAHNAHSGVVIQAALRRSPADVERLIEERAPIRLCKGAYREPAGVAFQAKAEVDRAYVTLMERLLRAGEQPAIATHDERIIRRALEVARAEGVAPERFEFQMLYGVRRDLQEQLVRDGWRVRVYVPYGREWYPYFMRRLAERPANVAFVVGNVLRERRGPSGT